eukprot:13812975-Alexandrium_andersonii.AAC.1
MVRSVVRSVFAAASRADVAIFIRETDGASSVRRVLAHAYNELVKADHDQGTCGNWLFHAIWCKIHINHLLAAAVTSAHSDSTGGWTQNRLYCGSL